MSRRFVYSFIAIIIGGSLAGCQHFHSAQADVSLKNQCINMRREQLFLNANSRNQDQFQVQRKQAFLSQAYQDKGCNQILQINKTTPKEKTKK